MTKTRARFKALGARTGKTLLACAVALSFTPGLAFAPAKASAEEQASGTAATHFLAPGSNGTSNWPSGEWSNYNKGNDGTYTWSTYVKGDGNHYGHYALDATFTVSEGQLTAIDLTSPDKVVGGPWCNSGSTIVGSLPKGVTNTTTVDAENKTVTPNFSGAEQYGGWQLVAGKNSNPVVFYKATQSEGSVTLDAGTNGTASNGTYSFAGSGDGEDGGYNVVAITPKIGDYFTFTVYMDLGEGKFAETLNKQNATDYSAALGGIGAKNREMWTQTAFASIVEQQLAGLVNSNESLDAVTSATKSSHAIMEALYASRGIYYPISNNDNPMSAARPDGWNSTPVFTSVSDNLKLTMDGGETAINTAASVKKTDAGFTVENNFSKTFDFTQNGGTAVNLIGYDLYSMADKSDATNFLRKNATQAYSAITSGAAKASFASKLGRLPVASALLIEASGGQHTPLKEIGTQGADSKNLSEYGSKNAATYSSSGDAKTLTITDPSVTHAVLWYNHDTHNNYCGVVCDLDALAGGGSTGTAISDADVTVSVAEGGYTYDGTAKIPDVTVKSGETTLAADTDYTLAYGNNVNAGTATVVVKGKGNYSGTVGKIFQIAPANFGTATVESVTNQTYSGSALTPALTVKVGDKALVQETDYTVQFANNVNAGTATVTLAGTGNYAGNLDPATFTIDPLAYTESNFTVADIEDQALAPEGAKPGVTVSRSVQTRGRDGKAVTSQVPLTSGTDYDVSYTSNDKLGDATATVTFKGNYSGTATKTFKVVQGQNVITAADVFKAEGAAAFKLEVATYDDSAKLSYASDNEKVATVDEAGTVTPKAAGTANITITAADTTSYKGATKTIKLTVRDAGQVALESGKTVPASSAAGVVSVKADSSGGVVVTGIVPSSKKPTIDTVTIGGKSYPVTTIAAGALKGTNVTAVTLGNNVKTVKANAFSGAAKLKSVTLGSGVAKLEKGAFKGAKKLKTLTVKSKALTTKASVKNCLKSSKVTKIKLSGLGSAKKKVKKALKSWGGKKSVKIK